MFGILKGLFRVDALARAIASSHGFLLFSRIASTHAVSAHSSSIFIGSEAIATQCSIVTHISRRAGEILRSIRLYTAGRAVSSSLTAFSISTLVFSVYSSVIA